MDTLALILHEAKLEIRAGFRSGIVTLTFFGLVLYLLMCLTNADYMQEMGGADIPRNSASIIYLMGTGCMFFQFFAWAWIFAQPVLRDRKASLHEVVLTTPNALTALLWGRFLGAAVIGAILSAAVLVGFIFAPVLVWLGMAPAASIPATPWGLLIYAWLWLQIPVSLGVGALYFLGALRTRSLVGPFALAALTLLLWMVGVVVLKGGGISPELATIIDPSLFTFAYDQVEQWTPAQKIASWLPFSGPALANRFVWCVLPLALLAYRLSTATRESLVLAKPGKDLKKPTKIADASSGQSPQFAAIPAKAEAPSFGLALRQFFSETIWRVKQITTTRAFWVGVAILTFIGMGSSFIHVVWHAEGPMSPDTELLLPLLKDTLFLYIAFMVAALAGFVYRRDDVTGFRDMFSATPVANIVRAMSCALAIAILTLMLVLVAGVAGALVVLLSGSGGFPIVDSISYQLMVIAPPMLEIAMIAFMVHALLRHAGLAYALTMLITFFLILNHELKLISYPPFEVGIPAHIHLSALDGWAPWRDYLAALDSYKVTLGLLLAAIGGIVMPRGWDSRRQSPLAHLKSRLLSPIGAVLTVAILGLVVLGGTLRTKLVAQGGYQSAQEAHAADAAWETTAVPKARGFEVVGGDVALTLDLDKRQVHGSWNLDQVMATGPSLSFELPHGFQLDKAIVNGVPVAAEVVSDQLFVPLTGCDQPSCQVTLSWNLELQGWDAEGHSARLGPSGVWLRSKDLMPRLGFDPERFVRHPAHRKAVGLPESWPTLDPMAVSTFAGVAPRGHWRWQVQGRLGDELPIAEQGTIDGPLDFGVAWSPAIAATESEGLTISHTPSQKARVAAIARDVSHMRACVHKRLGGYVPVRKVTPWPRLQGRTKVTGETLQLAENPHWDIADQGTGRWLRRAAIARALASHHITSTTGIRRVDGAVWLTEGVAGAIGLICVAERDGLDALQLVLARYVDRSNRRFSAAMVPIGPLATAPIDGWAWDYAPMAALNWTLAQTPQSFADLLARIASEGKVPEVIAALAGQDAADLMLGPPLSSAIARKDKEGGGMLFEGKRSVWRKGGWQPLDQAAAYRFLTVDSTRRLVASDQVANQDTKVFILDNWPSFPRDPSQNMIGGAKRNP